MLDEIQVCVPITSFKRYHKANVGLLSGNYVFLANCQDVVFRGNTLATAGTVYHVCVF